jgi:CHAD domain-containing protein
MAEKQAAGNGTKKKPRGLAHWMRKTLEECDKVKAEFAPDPVHDLRVAIRRCRSLADGFIGLDPDPEWKRMKKEAKALFQALGELRDVQVMRGWVERVGQPGEPASQALLAHIDKREQELKAEGLAALDNFDRQQWRKWSATLPGRARRLPLESAAFQHMALERWEEARKLHLRAMRSRSQSALHQLRIGVKRFRYTLENFLPQRHAAWGRKLSELQDLLGEVHDLDVLWQTARQVHAFTDAESETRWQARIQQEQGSRVEKYSALSGGKQGLWAEWRAGLPAGEKLRAAGMAKLAAWAGFRDPEFARSRSVARLALKIYDGLGLNGAKPEGSRQGARTILQAAALVRDVGRRKGERKYQKHSYKQIAKLEPPLGWSAEDLRVTALAARYHRGGLPNGKIYQELNPSERRETNLLAGILRVAERLGTQDEGAVVRVSSSGPAVVLEADGFDEFSPLAAKLARDRYLLEVACGKPVVIRKTASS